MNNSIPPTIHTIRALDNFHAWLVVKMDENDVSCEKLAKEIGCSKNTIQSWKSKTRYPRLDQLAAVYSFFGEELIQIPFR